MYDFTKMDELVKKRDELLAKHKDNPAAIAEIWQHYIEMMDKLLFQKDRVTQW